MAGGSEAVARAIEKAASPKHPRTRYPVTVAARMLMLTRRVLPDRGWGVMMRMQFKSPRAE